MHDVFISHASADKTVADAVCGYLEASGIRCWIAPRDVLPGVTYAEALTDAIEGARVMVLVFSQSSNTSQAVIREVEQAVRFGMPIIPFRIEDVIPTRGMAYYVESLHWLDALTPPLERHLEKLTATVRQLLGLHGEETPPLMPAPPQVARLRRVRLAKSLLALALMVIGGWLLYDNVLSPKPDTRGQPAVGTPDRLVIAGKRFLESSILLELIAVLIEQEHPGVEVKRSHYRGNSAYLFSALSEGRVHIYPEYSGTVLSEFLKVHGDVLNKPGAHELETVNKRLLEHAGPGKAQFLSYFGFDNPYVLVILRSKAAQWGLSEMSGAVTVSQLAEVANSNKIQLRLGASPGFRSRRDGVDALEEKYALHFTSVQEIAHSKAYDALEKGLVDAIDGYLTDEELRIAKARFVVLQDDRYAFTRYLAGVLANPESLPPEVIESLHKLSGTLTADDVAQLISECRNYFYDDAVETSEAAQQELRNVAISFLLSRGVLDAPNGEAAAPAELVRPVAPADNAHELGKLLHYKWAMTRPGEKIDFYEIERVLEDGRRFVHRTRQDAYVEKEKQVLNGVGRIRWQVTAHTAAGEAHASEQYEVYRYDDAWQRICETGHAHLGIGKLDSFFREDEQNLAGHEYQLVAAMLNHAYRAESCGENDLDIGWEYVEWGPEFFGLLTNPLVDLLASRISITKEREKLYGIRFTRPLVTYPQSIMTLAEQMVFDGDRLLLRVLGAQSNTTNYHAAKTLLGPTVGEINSDQLSSVTPRNEVRFVVGFSGDQSDYEELEALVDGKIHGIIADKPFVLHLLRQAAAAYPGVEFASVDVPLEVASERIGWALRIRDKQLRERLNSAIAENSGALARFEQQVLMP